MKRSIIFFFLLCSSLFSFSQREITNKSHPFQVLFADSAVYIEKEETVKQFDFLSINDSLKVKGEIVLIHFTGKISVLSDLKFSVEDLGKIRYKEGYFERPVISNMKVFINKSISEKPKNQMVSQSLILLYPEPNNDEIFKHQYLEPLFLAWKILSYYESAETKITIKTIFDEILIERITNETSIEISLDELEVREIPLIVRIHVLTNFDQEYYNEIAVFLEQGNQLVTSKNEYTDILKALSKDWSQNKIVANIFYKKAIEESNQDPRFIKLYEDFLERNPEFK
ncbi:MAG: hypothetical protein AB8B73_10500 [Ekhidna sp.]